MENVERNYNDGPKIKKFRRRRIGFFQFHPAVAALSSYGAVNLETGKEKRHPV
jgi:hypothetical protein